MLGLFVLCCCVHVSAAPSSAHLHLRRNYQSRADTELLMNHRKKRRSKMAAAQRDGSILRSTSMDRVTSYGSFGGASLDRTTSFDSGDNSGSPRSASSFEVEI